MTSSLSRAALLLGGFLLFLLLGPSSSPAAITTINGSDLQIDVSDTGAFQGRRIINGVPSEKKLFFPADLSPGNAGLVLAFPSNSGLPSLDGFHGVPPTFTAASKLNPSPGTFRKGFIPVSQSGVSGAGTTLSPFLQVTVYEMRDPANPGTSVIRITQEVTHVSGSGRFDVRYSLQNNTSGLLRFRTTIVGDLFLDGSDVGYGTLLTDSSGSFLAGVNPANDLYGGLLNTPGNLPDASYEGNTEDVWTRILNAAPQRSNGVLDPGNPNGQALSAGTGFEAVNLHDNAVAQQYNDRLFAGLAPSASISYTTQWRFQPPVITASPLNGTVRVGSEHNMNIRAFQLDGQPLSSRLIMVNISGQGWQAVGDTNANGEQFFGYKRTSATSDTIAFGVDYNATGNIEPGEPTVSGTVQWLPNAFPIAALQASSTAVGRNQVVSFNASASSDSDGSISRYEFDLDNNGSFETNTGGPTASRSFPDFGNHTVNVRVTDNDNASSLAGVTIAVNNSAPIASFSGPESVKAGGQASFNASASSDPDGHIVRYDWDLDGNGSFEVSGTSALAEYAYPQPGTFTINLVVTDEVGGQNSISRQIIVLPNDNPIADFKMPDSSQPGEKVFFDGSISRDPDGQVVKYSWDFNSDGVSDANTAVASYAFPAKGPTQVSLSVSDDKGGTGSVSKSFTVGPDRKKPIIIKASASKLKGSQLITSLSTVNCVFNEEGNCSARLEVTRATAKKLGVSTRKKTAVIARGALTPGTSTPTGAGEVRFTSKFALTPSSTKMVAKLTKRRLRSTLKAVLRVSVKDLEGNETVKRVKVKISKR